MPPKRRALVTIALLPATLLPLGVQMPMDDNVFEQKIPNTVVSFKMVRLPDGVILHKGKEYPIRNLWISETEITWDVYDIWAFRLDQSPEEQAAGVDALSRPTKPYGAPDRGFGHAGYPAIGMTYYSASEFCKWLSQKTGRKYRLPKEWEWEYAARAGARAEPENLDEVAWYRDNAGGKTHPVGKKKPNAWGLFDCLGNVWEWCTDAEGEPVACGGAYTEARENVSYGARARQSPKWNETDPQFPKSLWWLSDAPFVGFRVVCEG
jgi:formylglycine-generating enzyme required for sulfatase activity